MVMSTPVAPCCLRKKSKPLSVMHDLASGCFCRWVSCSSLSLTSFQLHSGYPAISCFPASFMPYPRLATPPASSSTWRPHVCGHTMPVHFDSLRLLLWAGGSGGGISSFETQGISSFGLPFLLPLGWVISPCTWLPGGVALSWDYRHLLSVSSGHDLLGSRVRVLFILSIS